MAYVATIGFFDGVHTGHRYLISRLREQAARRGLDSAILTFEQHPETILRGTPKPLLTTFAERTALLKAQGVTEIFCFNFEVIQMMTAREFMQILHNNCGVSVLLMGYDHRFGSDQLSRIEDYQAEAAQVGLTIIPIDQAPEGAVSSSMIRRALQRGAIESANIMLGYTYQLSGTVARGRGLGRKLGFPTANIEVEQGKMLPKTGVYAVRVGGLPEQQETMPGVLNIGTNPTIGENDVTLEVHIPGFDGDLYGQQIRVELLNYLREERRFESLDDLSNQIAKDINQL